MEKWIIFVPKNGGLKSCRRIIEKLINDENISNFEVLEVRGEDIPFFVCSLINRGKNAMGVTGEDLFREWELENQKENLDIIRRYEWKDKNAKFGKPVLCLMGPKGKKLKDLGKKLNIAISNKYKKISNNYLLSLERRGYEFRKIYLRGGVEFAFSFGIVDLIIDIFYSGKSAEEAGLECYEKIFESDIVIISDKNLFKKIPKILIKK